MVSSYQARDHFYYIGNNLNLKYSSKEVSYKIEHLNKSYDALFSNY